MDDSGQSGSEKSDATLALERRALAEVERLLDLDGDARGAALTALEAEDAELGRAVRRLLARDTDVHDWLPTEAPGLWERESDRLPERIGPFKVTGVLGTGGMGIVLRGERDDGLFEQAVAIKLVRAGLASLSQQERFLLERRILARLDHPAIARILDGGVWQDRPYLVMDLIDGMPLTAFANARDLGLDARITLFRQVCAVVQYAHRQLIVHADLKPSNILVTPAGAVKLLDFGIARLIEDEGLTTPADSGRGGSVTLTRAYAPPERRAGARPTIEGDVFSLGAILYELLAGRIGLPGDREADASAWPPPSRIAGLPAIPAKRIEGDLDAVVAKALAHDPDARYPDVTALDADIERWVGNHPVSVRRGTRAQRAIKFVSRHKRGFAITASVGLALLASAIFAGAQAVRAERARAVAEQRFNDVRDLARTFDTIDDLARFPGTVARRAQLAETGARYLARLQASGDAPIDIRVDAARGWRRLAELRGLPATSNTGESDKALAALDRAEALLRERLAKIPRDADALGELGWVHLTRWTMTPDTPAATTGLIKAKAAFERARAVRPRDQSAALGLIVLRRASAYDLLWNANRPADAVPVTRDALATLREARWPPAIRKDAERLEIGLLNQLGDALYYAGDITAALAPYREADAHIDRAIARDGATPGWQIAKAVAAWNLSGTISEIRGDRAQALAIATRGVATMEALLAAGPDSSAEKILLILYGQQASVHEAMGKPADALAPLARATALREIRAKVAPNDWQRQRDLAIGLIQQARILGLVGRRAEACAVANRNMAVWNALKSRNQLSRFDAENEVPKTQALRTNHCA